MKNGQIFAYKSTNRGALDIEYLDETSQKKEWLRERALNKSEVGKKLKAFADYASKETVGQVHAGGFLHNLVRINSDGTSTSPIWLSNEERKTRIVESWLKHLDQFPSSSKNPVIQHRLVLSMSTEQHDAFVAVGINPDQVLHITMKKIMKKFGERFHNGDSIGYAYGFHHDTDNLHVHVALCPRTKLGKYVGCSTSRSKTSKHKRQMDYLRECFELENKRWEKDLSQPQKLDEILAERRDCHKIVFNPRLTAIRRSQLVADHNGKVQQLQQMYTHINAMELNFQKLLQERDARKASAAVFRFFGGFVKRPRSPPILIPRVNPNLSISKQRQQLFELKRKYRRLHNEYKKTYPYDYGAHQTEKNRIHGYRNSNSNSLTI
ncbi:MAG: hypothetical protein C5B47_08010 [Verrucomicrobia bacterium]|nr:MAG: hypothetical protein C5B47_08010 [Verrucomicrobiota bacterium]